MAALRFAPLKLSATGSNPHLRLMAVGARTFSSGGWDPPIATGTRLTSFVRIVQAASLPFAAPSPGPPPLFRRPSIVAYIKGTVNEPTEFPPTDATHGSYHWLFERTISIALIPLMAAGAVKHGASGVLDATLALSLVLHSHIGITASLMDYLHKRKFPVAGPIASWTLRAATLATLAGLYEFQTNDIGFTEVISRVWQA